MIALGEDIPSTPEDLPSLGHLERPNALSPFDSDDDSEFGDEKIFTSLDTPASSHHKPDPKFEADVQQLSDELATFPVENALGVILSTEPDLSKSVFGVAPSRTRLAFFPPVRCANCAFSINNTAHRGCICKSSLVGPLYSPPASPSIHRGIAGLDGSPEPLISEFEWSEDMRSLEAALALISLVDSTATSSSSSEQVTSIDPESNGTVQGEFVGRLVSPGFLLVQSFS